MTHHGGRAGGAIDGDISAHLGFLDAVRGLAALWVVLNHLEPYLPRAADDIPEVLHAPLIEYGGHGIQVFFVLSGFVIAHSLRRSTMDGAGLVNFLRRRMRRLTPPYYAAVLLALVVSFTSAVVKDEVWDAPSLGEAIAHALYLPDLLDLTMINGVHWTLYLEVQFYALFGLTMWLLHRFASRITGIETIAMWAIGAIALVYPLFDLREGRMHFFLPYWYAFVLGTLVQRYLSGRTSGRLLGSFSGLLALSFVLHRDTLVAASLVAGAIVLVSVQGGGAQRWLRGPVFEFLGKISFSLYLVHAPVMGAVYYAVIEVLGDSPSAELIAIVPEVAASIVVAWLFFRWFERPAIVWSRAIRVPSGSSSGSSPSPSLPPAEAPPASSSVVPFGLGGESPAGASVYAAVRRGRGRAGRGRPAVRP